MQIAQHTFIWIFQRLRWRAPVLSVQLLRQPPGKLPCAISTPTFRHVPWSFIKCNNSAIYGGGWALNAGPLIRMGNFHKAIRTAYAAVVLTAGAALGQSPATSGSQPS